MISLIFKNKNLIVISIIIIIGITFYWYEWRPSQILKECSWVRVVEPQKEAITKEMAEKSKEEYDECIREKESIDIEKLSLWEKLNYTYMCNSREILTEREYVPENIYYREATKEEVDFCIHANGLK